MTVQNVIGGQTITNVQPPPEGTMAASIAYELTFAEPTISQNLQLSSQGGLMISQVCSLFIDNSQNAYPISVTHGVLSEVAPVPAGATAIVPTFSNKGPYPITVQTSGSIPPNVNLNVTVDFLNFPRQPGTFSATQQATIAATGQNTIPLYSSVFSLAGTVGASLTLLPAGNYILDSLDIGIEGVNASAAGLCTIQIGLGGGVANFNIMQFITNAAGAGFISGGSANVPVQRTWPQGLILPRGKPIIASVVTVASVTTAFIRANLSGLNTP